MRPCVVLACLLATPVLLLAQEDEERPPPDLSEGSALNLGVGNSGLSIGNSSWWNGVRINFRDRAIRRINGVNLTIWQSDSRTMEFGTVNGLAIGGVPEAGYLNGVSVGLGVIAHQRAAGVNLGLLGLITDGEGAWGLNIGGLGAVADGGMNGINVGGLGLVADGGPDHLHL